MHSSPHVLIIAMVAVWSTNRTSQQVTTYSEQCCPICLFPFSFLSYNSYFVFLALITCLFQNWIEITYFSVQGYPRTHGLAPQYITDLINVKQQFGRMMLRSQSELQLLPPRTITKKTLGDRSFMASAPKLWNRLPSNIRAVNDPNCFKTLLKTRLFRQAFSCLLL